MAEPILKQNELNGKKIAYHSETEFVVQVRSYKGKYRDVYRIVGNLGQAVLYFNGINVGYGYAKRLLMPSSKKPVLAKVLS